MPYPSEIDNFPAKLNRQVEPFTVTDEIHFLTNGAWAGFLDHDNMVAGTLQIWTGTGRTGSRVLNFTVDTLTDLPWKAFVQVYAGVEMLYFNYDSRGDQVEAEDINRVQSSLTETQRELERHKTAGGHLAGEGVIDGGSFD